jgi:hypothetical protein
MMYFELLYTSHQKKKAYMLTTTIIFSKHFDIRYYVLIITYPQLKSFGPSPPVFNLDENYLIPANLEKNSALNEYQCFTFSFLNRKHQHIPNRIMTSKATQEYRSSFITLISQLSEIEQKGKEFFDKMYNEASHSRSKTFD